MTDDTTDPAEEERASTPGSSGPERAAGAMGSSSERIGPTGPGQVGTDGMRDTSPVDPDDGDGTPPPEQSPGGEEPNPLGVEPKAGYPQRDPRSEDRPYRP